VPFVDSHGEREKDISEEEGVVTLCSLIDRDQGISPKDGDSIFV
jgi:hypothetical protein